jgi:hypothetical protein
LKLIFGQRDERDLLNRFQFLLKEKLSIEHVIRESLSAQNLIHFLFDNETLIKFNYFEKQIFENSIIISKFHTDQNLNAINNTSAKLPEHPLPGNVKVQNFFN